MLDSAPCIFTDPVRCTAKFKKRYPLQFNGKIQEQPKTRQHRNSQVARPCSFDIMANKLKAISIFVWLANIQSSAYSSGSVYARCPKGSGLFGFKNTNLQIFHVPLKRHLNHLRLRRLQSTSNFGNLFTIFIVSRLTVIIRRNRSNGYFGSPIVSFA